MTGAGGVVLWGEVLSVGVGEPRQAAGRGRIAVSGLVDHGQTLLGEAGAEYCALGGVLTVVAEPLHQMLELPVRRGVEEGFDGFRVVVELGESGGLVEGQLVGVLA